MAELLFFVFTFFFLTTLEHLSILLQPLLYPLLTPKAHFLRLFGFPLCTNKQFSRNLTGFEHLRRAAW